MINVQKLLESVARLQATDTAAVAMLTDLRNQNKAAQAQLAEVSAKLADLDTEGATDLQKTIDDVANQLGQTADQVEAAVAANPAVPNMPAPPPEGA